MIPKERVEVENCFNLTRAEALAFVIFEIKEKKRHEGDIVKIREDLKGVCKVHDIKGLELNALYTQVYA